MNRFCAWVVQRFYGALAWAYDPLAWTISGGLWYRWVCAAEPFVADGPVLEIGCGRGRLLSRLAGRGMDVTGVDKSPQMVAAAERRLSKAGLPGSVIRADARALPLPDARFGTVISTFPSSVVLDDQTWAECARVLRPTGRWVVILGIEGFSLRALGTYVGAFLKHLGSDKRTVERVTRLFPRELAQDVQVGRTRVPVFVLDQSRVESAHENRR